MSRIVLAAVLCVGCYGPTIQSGSACVTVCPGDLVCVEQVCREPGFTLDAAATRIDARLVDAVTIDGPPGDADADGVLDNVDNCPARADADQHDEDGDVLGDACDPCPDLAGDAADSDADGVGDACDPQPTLAKQVIRFFDPFTSDKPEWQHSGGATRVGETLRTLASANSSAHTRLNVATGELRIATGGTIVAAGSSTPRQLSIAYGFDSTGDDYHYCEFYNSSGGSIAINKANSGTYTGLATHSFSGVLPTGAWSMVIDESVASQQIKLVAKLGGTSYTQLTASTTTAAPSLITSAAMTIYVQNADIRYDYWLVIETLP